MKAIVHLVAGILISGLASIQVVAGTDEDADSWSKTTRDLQARVTLVEKTAITGTRSLVPYLELRNVGSSAAPIQVRCGGDHVKFELVDATGKQVREGWFLPRSGPHADPGTISLPWDSSIKVNMYCSNWGVPKDAAAMIATDSGAWVLKSDEKGKVFLKATIKGDKAHSDSNGTWSGTIESPLLKIDWKE